MVKFILIIAILLLSGCTTNPFIKQYNDLRSDYDSGKITEQQFRDAYQNLQEQANVYNQQQQIQQYNAALVFQAFGQVAQNAQYQQRLYEQQRLNTITNLIHHDNYPPLQTYNYQPTKIYQREHTQCTPNGFGGFNCDTTQQ